MYQVVPGGAGGTVTNATPIKQKLKRDARPLVVASVLGLVLVVAAVTAWCYYIGSLRKAELLKTELLDLNKDGYIIRNQAGAIVFRMSFRFVICFRIGPLQSVFINQQLLLIIMESVFICDLRISFYYIPVSNSN